MENDEVYMLHSQDLQAFSVEGSDVKLRSCFCCSKKSAV